MNAATRRMLAAQATEADRAAPAIVEPALQDGVGRYARRVAWVYAALFAVAAVVIGALVVVHPATGALFPKGATLDRVVVSPGQLTVAVGDTALLAAEGHFTDGTIEPLTSSAAWSSSDATVATVDPGGMVTAEGPGTAIISAVFEELTGTATVVVTESPQPTLTGITVTPDPVALERGDSAQLEIVGHYSDGTSSALADGATWTTSDDKVVQITAQGLATAVGENAEATIRAQLDGFEDTLTVTVAPALVEIEVEPAEVAIEEDSSAQLRAIGTFSDGSTRELMDVEWLMGDETIATIDQSGLVVGLKPGDTEVKAARDGLGGTASISVYPIVE